MRNPTIGLLAILLLVLAGCGGSAAHTAQMSSNPPADLDYAAARASDAGMFQVTYTSELDPIAINELHSWTIHIETPEGAPVEGAIISVTGGMPEHNHGMPTQPKVTEDLGGGNYRVEGMQFQMNGWWTMEFAIEADGQQDSVTFNLNLK